MFNLTKQERQVVLFLFAIAFTGSGINFFLKTHCRVKPIASFNENLGKVNLNKADNNALMSVSGIGRKLSERLLFYRKERGRFSSIDELKNIKGINQKKFEKLKSSLYIE